ncbi:uncharacterized protein LOC105901673 [Clupea harengus]|uniref:Uncharacterized protein LOC105901673 n=1 Tax=Clupea harengus TaxID=7950 RepID=A0A6P8GBF2_CLUHA|nr:uncharacterized protein LOC105901673 [Clupea harengus]
MKMLVTWTQWAAFTVLLFATCESSVIPPASVHEGQPQSKDSCSCAIPTRTADVLKNPSCEGQLIINRKVSAVYEDGRVANSTHPVKFVSVEKFTLDMCPVSAYILAECSEQNIFHNDTCVCMKTTESPTTFPAPPLTILETPSENSGPHSRHHFILGVVLTLAVIFGLILTSRKLVAYCTRKDKPTLP